MTLTLAEMQFAAPPTAADAELALESSRRLTKFLAAQPDHSLRIRIEPQEESISIPISAFRLLNTILTEMAQGNAVTLIPTHAELTTQQAADLLNVSRPFLVKLLDEGKMPSRMVGKFRRVRFDDLMNYKRKDDETRAKVLDQLTAEAQELGLGY